MNVQRCMIFGASGFVGGELLRLLAGHPSFEVGYAIGANSSGEAVSSVHPHLVGVYDGLRFSSFDESMLESCDLVFAAMPHGESQRLAPTILGKGVRLIDLGADFRLDDASAFERWYGEPHRAPGLLDRFAYGIPELGGISPHTHAVAAAGCYATAAILVLKPLIDAGLLAPGTIIVDGMSGVTGAGKEPKAATHFDRVHGGIGAYGLLNHRHTAEMEMVLGREVLFTPHLVPMDRGILVTCHAPANGPCDPLEVLRAAYDEAPFVHVVEGAPTTKAVAGSNGAQVTARYDPRTDRLLALGVIDNLGKGAAGQMIQCANLVAGLAQTAGLTTIGVYP